VPLSERQDFGGSKSLRKHNRSIGKTSIAARLAKAAQNSSR
jgi:hypothetical protein